MTERLKESWAALIVSLLVCVLMIWNGNRRYDNGRKHGLFIGAVGYHNYVVQRMEKSDQDSVSTEELLDFMKEIINKKDNGDGTD